MKSSFERLRHVRLLLEEMARRELEMQSLAMRQIEDSAERQRQLAGQARSEALELLCAGRTEAGTGVAALMDAEIFSWKAQRLSALAAASQPALESAREEMLARRRERLQIEALLAAALRAEEKERMKREQKHLDDWAQTRNSRGLRPQR